MRTWEEMYNKHLNMEFDKDEYPKGYPYIELAAKEYAKEAIEECAENAHVTYIAERYSDPWQVDKESILSLIKELK